METAKLFNNGRSQAVRLPKSCRFEGNEVYIRKLRGVVVLVPKDDPWASLVHSLEHFSQDYMENRDQPDTQDRSSF